MQALENGELDASIMDVMLGHILSIVLHKRLHLTMIARMSRR